MAKRKLFLLQINLKEMRKEKSERLHSMEFWFSNTSHVPWKNFLSLTSNYINVCVCVCAREKGIPILIFSQVWIAISIHANINTWLGITAAAWTKTKNKINTNCSRKLKKKEDDIFPIGIWDAINGNPAGITKVRKREPYVAFTPHL